MMEGNGESDVRRDRNGHDEHEVNGKANIFFWGKPSDITFVLIILQPNNILRNSELKKFKKFVSIFVKLL